MEYHDDLRDELIDTTDHYRLADGTYGPDPDRSSYVQADDKGRVHPTDMSQRAMLEELVLFSRQVIDVIGEFQGSSMMGMMKTAKNLKFPGR